MDGRLGRNFGFVRRIKCGCLCVSWYCLDGGKRVQVSQIGNKPTKVRTGSSHVAHINYRKKVDIQTSTKGEIMVKIHECQYVLDNISNRQERDIEYFSWNKYVDDMVIRFYHFMIGQTVEHVSTLLSV